MRPLIIRVNYGNIVCLHLIKREESSIKVKLIILEAINDLL